MADTGKSGRESNSLGQIAVNSYSVFSTLGWLAFSSSLRGCGAVEVTIATMQS